MIVVLFFLFPMSPRAHHSCGGTTLMQSVESHTILRGFLSRLTSRIAQCDILRAMCVYRAENDDFWVVDGVACHPDSTHALSTLLDEVLDSPHIKIDMVLLKKQPRWFCEVLFKTSSALLTG